MINTKKRVSLNRRASSLLLDYQAMIPNTTGANGTVANDYTRQLVESALSLPASVKVTTQEEKVAPKTEKLIELPVTVLLKSSLRTPKCASAPCSPTTGMKSVQFSKNNLEDVCLFRKAQTPLAISQKNIFWGDDDEETSSSSSSSSSSDEEQEIQPIKTLHYANWPTRLSDIIDKKTKVIRIEKSAIRLMTDLIVGKVLVRNIDYHKTVTIRYTFDYWETIDNIKAKYHQQQDDNKTNNSSYDVFSFKIKLPPNATTMYFAIHYKVGDQDYWESNDGRNYEVQIKTTIPIKKNKKTKKTKTKSTKKEVEDVITNTVDHTKEDGLKARYDFGQSIHQAKNNIILPSFEKNNKQNIRPIAPIRSHSTNSIPTTIPPSSTTSIAMPIPIRRRNSSSPTGLSCHSPVASSPSFMDLNSQSYMELVNKYCFYSTSPSRSPMSING